MLRRLITAAAIALAGSFAFAQTDVPRLTASDAGKIQFQSANRGTGADILYKGKARYDDTIVGDLVLPSGSGKVPAVILMHGSGGPDAGSARDWAAMIGQMGIATFLVDSFTSRGISGTGTNQSLLTYTTSGIDGLKALEILATHPRIDPSRIGVIGFSRGGVAAQEASFERFRSAVLPGTGRKFALHVVIYGGCAQHGTTTGAPVLHLMGDKDDYNSVEPCQKMTDLTNARGGQVRLVVYPGALHGFDRPEIRRQYLHGFQTWRECRSATNMDDLTLQLSGKPLATLQEVIDHRNSCMTTGIDYGGDSTHAAQARDEVRALLAKVFGQ